MLYDPEMMRNIAAQQHKDRLQEAETDRLVQEAKGNVLPAMKLTGIISAFWAGLKPNRTGYCAECQVMIGEAKS